LADYEVRKFISTGDKNFLVSPLQNLQKRMQD